MTLFSEPQIKTQGLRLQIYQWDQGQKVMAAPDNPNIVALGVHEEVVKH